MNKSTIIKEFTDTYPVNNKWLEIYINFCEENKLANKKKYSHGHHILPVALFPEYKDFKIYKWNKAQLSYDNHYIAHCLLVLTYNHESIVSAFWGMNNKNYRNGEQLEIISPKMYNILMKKAIKNLVKQRKGMVIAKNKITGINEVITQEEFINSGNYVGVMKDKICAINKETGNNEILSKEEYYLNKENYLTHTSNKVVCRNIYTGEQLRVSRDEFNDNDDLVGIRHNKKSEIIKCKYCEKGITIENINVHEKTHHKYDYYITDYNNQNTIKVSQADYYLKYKDTHYITESGMIIYKDGRKVRKRKQKTGPLQKVECKVCGKLIGGIYNFRRHIETSHNLIID